MANINFDDYKKNQEAKEEESEKISLGKLDVKTTQYYIKEKNLLFDFQEIDFGDPDKIIIEIWMSFLGEDLKMKVDVLTKDEYNELDIPEHIIDLMEDNLGCLECKSRFLRELCKEEEEMNDDDDDSGFDFFLDNGEDEEA